MVSLPSPSPLGQIKAHLFLLRTRTYWIGQISWLWPCVMGEGKCNFHGITPKLYISVLIKIVWYIMFLRGESLCDSYIGLGEAYIHNNRNSLHKLRPPALCCTIFMFMQHQHIIQIIMNELDWNENFSITPFVILFYCLGIWRRESTQLWHFDPESSE